MVDLTEVNDGQTIHARLGTSLRVCLQEFPESGFAWHTSGGSSGHLTLVESKRSEGPGSPGAGGESCFTYLCEMGGKAELVLHLRRPWLRESLRTWRVHVAIT
jgi:predicted secreted protein